jgi:hypothetical protein
MAARNPAAIAIERLPERYRGGDPRLAGTRFRIHLGRIRRDVVIGRDSCEVVSPNDHEPDVEIRTDPETWLAMDAGTLSGIEAFGQRRLTIRGSIEKSLRFETLFERPDEGGLRYSLETVENGKVKVSALTTGPGDAPPLLLLHGLRGNQGFLAHRRARARQASPRRRFGSARLRPFVQAARCV